MAKTRHRVLLAIMVLIGLLVGAAVAQGQTSPVETVRRIRADYPAKPSNAQVGAIVYRVAGALGPDYGVLLKTSGSRCASPIGTISCDIIVKISERQEFDMLGNATGDPAHPSKPWAVPGWAPVRDASGAIIKCGEGPSGCDMARVRVVADGGPAEPVPGPGPTPDPTLIARVTALEQQLRQLTATVDRQVAALQAADQDLRAHVDTEVRDIRALIAALPAPGPVLLPLYKGTAKGWWGSATVISSPCAPGGC